MRAFICKGFSGEIFKVEIDVEQCAGDESKELALKLFYNEKSKCEYSLINLSKGFEYSPEDVIGENTSEDDLLLLINMSSVPGA